MIGFSLGGLPVVGQPQSRDPGIELARLEAAIVLDGISEEAAWQRIDPLPMTMYQPHFEGPLTERTEIRVAYDERHLYIAGRFYDSDPDGIRGNALYRDRSGSDDTFDLVLDTFNDNDTALWFSTSPTGVRVDQSVANDAEFGSGEVFNPSWNTYWDVATVTNEEGWFMEMRIPYSSLGFQDQDGQVVMGLIANRYIARKNERHIYPAIPPHWTQGFVKPSQAQDVVLANVSSQRPLYITPYVLGSHHRSADINATSSAFEHTHDASGNVGVDVKYNVTNNVTLDVTVNTDFAQAEADDQVVNLSRFSPFFPEKRQFFQERSGLFDFNLGFQDRLFHSRQIGIEQGQEVRILGGARLVGRVADWDVGMLSMQTARSAGLSSENFGVLRLQHPVLNAYSYAGGMLTSRVNEAGGYNLTYGLDSQVQFKTDQYVTVKWAQSLDDKARGGLGETGRLLMQVEKQTRQGLYYQLRLIRSGLKFTPAVGFMQRQHVTAITGRSGYGLFPASGSRIRWQEVAANYGVVARNEDRSTESAWLTSWYYAEFTSGLEINPYTRFFFENLRAPLFLTSTASIPPGSYSFGEAVWWMNMAEGHLFRGSYLASAGTYYDGWKVTLSASPVWNASRFLEISATYQFNRIRFPNRDEGADTHLMRLRMQLALNTKLALSTFVQYTNTASLMTANMQFRYNVAEGNDLWIVINEGINTDLNQTGMEMPRVDEQTVLLKYTHTFRI